MKQQPYFRVVTSESDDAAEMYLYGYIGQDFWWSEELKEESITDLEFVRKLKELEQRYDRINVRINSPGGSVYHGDPIIAAINNSKAEIHTYNDGMAASMAADIWLSGQVRHMARNAKLMIHATSSICLGTAKDMRACGDMLDKFDQAAITSMSAATGMEEEEIRTRFYDYEDHWLTASECAGMGLIDQVEEYDVESMDDAEKMSYMELLQRFHQRMEKEEDPKGWLQRLKQFLFHEEAAPTKIQTPENTTEMNKQEFTSSLENGELTEDQVIEVLQSRGLTVSLNEESSQEAKPDTPAGDPVADARIEKLENALDSLMEKIDQLSSAPGAQPTAVQVNQDPDPEEEDDDDFLKQFDRQMAAIAKERDRAAFTQ